MLYRRKQAQQKQKKRDTHEQLVKLSRENQFLITKLEYMEQQIEHLKKIKDKYKNKYKQLKASFFIDSNSEEQLFPLKEELSTKKIIHKDSNPYSLKMPTSKKKNSTLSPILQNVQKSLKEFLQKMTEFNRKLDPLTQNNQKDITRKVEFLAQRLEQVITELHGRKSINSQLRQSRLHSSSASRCSERKMTNQEYVLSKRSSIRAYGEERSLGIRRQEKRFERALSESHSCWRLLKDIGSELRDIKLGIVDKNQLSDDENKE